MSNRSSVAVLSDRSLAVLAIISGIAAAGGFTPTNQEIDAALQAAGFPAQCRKADNRNKHCAVAYELLRLSQAVRIQLIGQYRYRTFLVIDLGLQTKPREVPTRTRSAYIEKMRAAKVHLADPRGWPERGAAQSAAYDAGMKLGPPIRIKGPTDAQRVFRAMHPGAPFSLTGNAGEMCAR